MRASMSQEVVCESPPMRALFAKAGDIATSASRAPVLLYGETGTGKEVLARYMHRHIAPPGPFVPVNCGALSPDLAESRLFGHEKGSRGPLSTMRARRATTMRREHLTLCEPGNASASAMICTAFDDLARQLLGTGTASDLLRQLRQSLIAAALEATNGNVRQAGKLLGLHGSNVYRYLPAPAMRELHKDEDHHAWAHDAPRRRVDEHRAAHVAAQAKRRLGHACEERCTHLSGRAARTRLGFARG